MVRPKIRTTSLLQAFAGPISCFKKYRDDAQHFRDQAAPLCLAIARQMSDRHTAGNLRVSAAQYFKKAAELDHNAEPWNQPYIATSRGGADR
jgi:hypothetical protein